MYDQLTHLVINEFLHFINNIMSKVKNAFEKDFMPFINFKHIPRDSIDEQ